MSTPMRWKLSTPEGAADVVVPALQPYKQMWLNNVTRVLRIAKCMELAIARVNFGCEPTVYRLAKSGMACW